jgi:nicotinamide-nucleotide amidase
MRICTNLLILAAYKAKTNAAFPLISMMHSMTKCTTETLQVLSSQQLIELSEQLGQQLAAKGWRVATAESCTGGAIAAAITAIAGSSAWFEYGIVSYANSAKHKLLGVSEASLARYGAVSEQVVRQMAQGAQALSGAELAVAVSGIAGPTGGSDEKPVGTVWFAWALKEGEVNASCKVFAGDRQQVQQQAVVCGLIGLIRLLEQSS